MKPENAATAASKDTTSEPLPLSQKIAYGIGMIPANGGNQGVKSIAMPVYAILLKVNPATLGLVLGLMRLWDAILDPVMGRITDNSRSRFGRRRPFIILGSILFGVCYPFLWWASPEWSEYAKVIYFVCLCLIFYVCYTVFLVPWNALFMELSSNYEDRSRIRAFNVYAGKLYFFVFPWLIPISQGDLFDDPITGVRVMTGIAGLAFLLFGVVSGFFTQERAPLPQAREEKISIFRSLKEFGRDPVFWKLKGIGLLVLLGLNLDDFLAQYVSVFYIFEGDLEASSRVSAIGGNIGQVAGAIMAFVVSQFLADKDKRLILKSCLALTLVGVVSQWWLLTPDYPYLKIIVHVYIAITNSAFWLLYGAMQPEFCDHDELATGKRRQGMYSAVSSWLNKAMVSSAIGMSGFLVILCGFDREAGADQSDSTYTLMRLAIIIVPFVFFSIAIWCCYLYPVGPKEARAMAQELKLRRETSA